MRNIAFVLANLILLSCAPIYNYQVFKTDYKDLKEDNNLLFYEDDNCTISYNLWSENGAFRFIFTNKTDSLIVVDLKECFLIVNGIAYDYFLNRTISTSSGVTVSNSKEIVQSNINSQNQSFGLARVSVQPTGKITAKGMILSNSRISESGVIYGNGVSQSRNKSIEIQEQDFVRIPSKASKILGEYNLVNSRIKDCDLKKTPTYKEKVDSVVFSNENSPLNFNNRVTYRVQGNDQKYLVENTFYVKKIMNMLSNEFFYSDYYIGCNGKKSLNMQEFMKYEKPGSFYIRYGKD